MRHHRTGIVRKSATCPECGGVYRWREQAGLKRFRAKAKRCPDCGHLWR